MSIDTRAPAVKYPFAEDPTVRKVATTIAPHVTIVAHQQTVRNRSLMPSRMP